MGDPTVDRRRNEHGQYADRIPLDRVLAVFEAREDRARPLTATDVMETLDCSRRTAHNKLNELVERGALETRKVGARSRVWWVPLPEESTPGLPESDDRPVAVSAAIRNADLPGSGPTLEARREALSAAYDYLTEYPEAKKADFLRDVYHDHSAGYESAEGWWNAIQPALKQLPGVDPPKERGHIWHFLGG
ncbi:helix-turn-helix domain-containing protein [Halegenticoccus tardaugens]|uniref:helix-turn-helix domain-containing protein n=1 Tax=Halegenticoccus tardaugens TaxID=2071624 RepID=UPI00100BBF1C|nr:helix-turn-helix domain-containing protein [Halegenticoccus tardaugens]